MGSINKAVIVAAGKSSRLYPLTLDKPKSLLEVAREPILCRSVKLLHEKGIKNVLIIVGYHRYLIQDALAGSASFKFNPFFAETNNMGSLWFAKDWIKDDAFLYMHGDIVYTSEMLASVLNTPFKDAALLVDPAPTDKEAMKVRIKSERFVKSSKDITVHDAFGEWTGIALFNRPHKLFYKIESLLEQKKFQAYDTLAFTEMANEGSIFEIILTDGLPWIEIDNETDLGKARKLFP